MWQCGCVSGVVIVAALNPAQSELWMEPVEHNPVDRMAAEHRDLSVGQKWLCVNPQWGALAMDGDLMHME